MLFAFIGGNSLRLHGRLSFSTVVFFGKHLFPGHEEYQTDVKTNTDK